MQYFTKNLLVFTLILMITSCASIDEKKQLSDLNNRYTDYFFKSSDKIYLLVYVKKPYIDTSEIFNIYSDVILNIDSTKEEITRKEISWLYMNVFDMNDDFCFQVFYDIYGKKGFVLNQRGYY